MKRKMEADLHALAVLSGVDEGPDGEQLGFEAAALGYVLAWINGGHPAGHSSTILSLARYLGVSRPVLSGWLGEEKRREAYRVARETSAACLVDEAADILDTATPYEAGLANSRANFRKWLASVYDRATYGQQVAPTVAINVAQLHLAAHDVRKLKATELREQQALGSDGVEYRNDTPAVMLQLKE